MRFTTHTQSCVSFEHQGNPQVCRSRPADRVITGDGLGRAGQFDELHA